MRFAMILAIGSDDLRHYAPLGLGSIAAYVSNKASWVEPEIFSDLSELIAFRPACVGISASTQNFDIACSIAKNVKEKLEVPVILGGPHISCLPDTLPPKIDYGIIGEGEKTIVELLTALKNGSKNFSRIDGICFHSEGSVVKTSNRRRISNLDRLPVPWRVGGELDEGRAHLMTSRGCPYKCLFCSAGNIWGTFKTQSAKRVVQEVLYLVEKYDVKKLHIYDDLFIADRRRLSGFAELIKKNGLAGRVRLSASVRANLVNDSLCKLLIKAGIKSVTFGAESADDFILRKVKPKVTAEDNENALRILSEHDIAVTVSMIVGFPEQTVDSMRDTYRFIARHSDEGRLSGAEVHLLSPFPCTQYYGLIREAHPDEKKLNWANFGRPWHGLLLNDSIMEAASELIGYDRRMRTVFSGFEKAAIAVCPIQFSKKELLRVAGIYPFRAVYRIGKDLDAEVIKIGEQDVALLSREDLINILNEIPKIPIFVFGKEDNVNLKEIQTALIRYSPDSDRALKTASGLKIINSMAFARVAQSDLPFEEISALPIEPLANPLDLFAGETVPENDFRTLLDEHARWIGKRRVG